MEARKLISVVDDDQPFRESMVRLLQLSGYTVESFPSAKDFLASPHLATTACLIADVQMPDMTGLELHRHLVKAGWAIPTILVTAFPSEEARDHALKDGVLSYFGKPVDDAQLDLCIQSAVQDG